MQKQALRALSILDSVRCTYVNHSVVEAMDTIKEFASKIYKDTLQQKKSD
jgi:hypothetical protein